MNIQLRPEFAQHLREQGIAVGESVEIDGEVLEQTANWLRSKASHAHESGQQILERAVYHLLWKNHGHPKHAAASLNQRIVELATFIGKAVRVAKWALIVVVLWLLALTVFAVRGHAQTTQIRGTTKGSTPATNATVTSVDANHNAVDVNIAAGGGTGGGPADAAPNAAASESDVARQKVTSVIRVLDTSQAAGSQLVTLPGDQTNGVFVNCKSGCSAAGDTTGSTQALGALNATASVTLAGESSASVFIAGGGNLVGTLVPEVSNDGGTTWFGTFFIAPATGALSTSQAVSSPSATMYTILLPGGADRARVRVSVYASGSSNGTLKSTAQNQSYPLKVSSAGVLSVDGSTVTQPVSNAGTFAVQAAESGTWNINNISGTISLPTGAAADSSLTTIDTDLKANVTLHAGSNIIGKVGIDQTTPGTTNAVAATNLPTTVDTNSGNKSASTLRVVLATDQPALTNKLLVTPDSVALPANQSVNENQIGGNSVTTTDNGTQGVALQATASSTGALTPCYVQSGTGTTASTNAANCKASAGNFYGVMRAVNTTGTIAYLRMYNLATSPTCSSATGFVESIPIPSNNNTNTVGAGIVSAQLLPFNYSTGIAYCVTGGGGNTDNTNAPAGVYITLGTK